MITSVTANTWDSEGSEHVDDTARIGSDWRIPSSSLDSDDSTLSRGNDQSNRSTGLAKQRSFNEPISKRKLPPNPINKKVKPLQQWECIVIDVKDDCVECELHDLWKDDYPVEIAEIYLDEFSSFDRPLLQEGVVFYWSIGQETSITGQIRRFSELRVRRMPRRSRLRQKEIEQEAKVISELLGTVNYNSRS